jgi:hypothetical protein
VEDVKRIAEELKKRAGSEQTYTLNLTKLPKLKSLTQPHRTRRPHQQLRLQLGRVLRHLPRRRLGPRPHPQPQTRLPTHPSRNPPARSCAVPALPVARHQHRLCRRSARPRARDLCLLGLQSRTAPHVARAGESLG